MAFDAHPFSEERDATGALRAGYEELFEALATADLASLSAQVNRHLALRHVTFGRSPFVVDPVPRLIAGAEWDELAAGLAQRARALNHFLRDAYGAQRIVEAGILPVSAIREAEGFEPDLAGRLPEAPAAAAIIGFDVVRDPDGRFLVLEDNARTPSGYEYALAVRDALSDTLPAGVPRPRPVEHVTGELLAAALRAAAPAGVTAPSMVVLTDGPDNVAYSEHSRAAARIGVPLVTLDQLISRGNCLRVSLPGGQEREVDVVYRRSDEDRIRDEHGRLTDVAWTLLPAWLSGNLGLVNAFGNGLADDKLIHGHVEEFIRFYLREEPIVRSVPTHAFDAPVDPRATRERLRRHVVKPRWGHGGRGVVIGPHASAAELERLVTEVTQQPGRFISQPTVALSRHPTVIAGQLEPRHIDLRAFAFSGTEVGVMPGGLSRVALEKDKLVVNSSQDGGGKDTWIVDESAG